MKKKQLRIQIVFYLLILYSCSKNEITQIPSPIKLKPINTYPISDGCFHDVFLIHDTLLIFISNCDTNYFHIYNKNTMTLVRKFGKKGKGPYDFNFPFPFKTNTIEKEEKDYFKFYDLNLPIIININFEKLISEYDFSEGIRSQIIDKNLFGPSELNNLQQNKISAIDNDNSNGLFFIYDTKTQQKKWIEYTPKVKMEKRYHSSAYRGTMCSDSVNILFAYKYFDQVSFYNIEGHLLNNYNFSKLETPILSKAFSGVDDEAMMYFLKSYGTSKYCYVQRVSQTWSSLRASALNQSQILVFDWSGNMVKCYEFEVTPYSFCIDEKEEIMYCVVQNSNKEGFINLQKYSLK